MVAKLLLFLFLLISPALANEPAPWTSDAGLIGYWKLDEASGSLIDVKGGHNLTTTGTVTYGNRGIFNKGVFFNGASYGKTTDAADWTPSSGAYTICAWMRDNLASVGANWVTQGRTAVSWGQADASGKWVSLGTFHNSVGVTYPRVATLAHGNGQVSSINVYDKWFFLCAACDGTNGKIYVNGDYIQTYNNAAYVYAGNRGSFVIGRETALLYNSFYGFVDEVRFYNRELAADEITALYLSGLPIKSGGE